MMMFQSFWEVQKSLFKVEVLGKPITCGRCSKGWVFPYFFQWTWSEATNKWEIISMEEKFFGVVN